MKGISKDLKERLCCIGLAIVALIMGFGIYLFLNQNNYYYSIIGDICKIPSITTKNFLSRIIICFGADYLWSMAYTSMVQALFLFRRKEVWKLLSCSLFGIVVELLQQLEIISGTPDMFDIVAYILGCLSVIIIIYFTRRKKNEKEN